MPSRRPPVSEPARSVSLVSLGCSKNQVDSERLLSGLLARGYRYETDSLAADLVVVNTCGFIGPAKQESLDTIVAYGKNKGEGAGRTLAVAGCLLERYPEELRAELPEVDHWLTGSLPAALEAVADRELGPARPRLQDPGVRSVLLNEPGMAYLRISQGCDRTCSFCAIPNFKGEQVSVPVEQLVAEARNLVEVQGAHELVLVAQDLCRYGTDIGYRPGLDGLIETLLAETGVRWLRFLYAYPFSLPDAVVERMAGEPRLVPYLDMPFQHADTGVLKAMRRGHGGERFLEYLDGIRARVPGLAVRSTMLVGFPGEDEAAFETLSEFVRRARFEWMGVFEYSDEDGTRAFDLPGKVDPEVAAERAERLREIYAEVRRTEVFGLGREQEALVVEVQGDQLACRLPTQAPEVDGLVFVPAPLEPVPIGSMVRVVPEDEDGFDFEGRWVGMVAPGRGPVAGREAVAV